MLIFLYGPETFLGQRKLKDIKAKFQAKYQSGLNFDIFDFEEKGPGILAELKNFLEAVSMFQEKKLAILKNVFSASVSQKEELTALLRKGRYAQNENVFLVLWGGEEPAKKDVLTELLKDKAVKKEKFAQLKGVKLKQWLLAEIKTRGGEIEGDALEMLALVVEDDLWRADSEIEKLLAFSPKITQESLAKLVGQKLKLNIFETVEAVSSGRKNQAWKLVYEHLNQGGDTHYLLSMIAYQFRNLAVMENLAEKGLAEAQIAKKAALHPFVVKKSLWQIKKLKPGYLAKTYQLLTDLDFKIKRGLVTPESALDILVAQS